MTKRSAIGLAGVARTRRLQPRHYAMRSALKLITMRVIAFYGSLLGLSMGFASFASAQDIDRVIALPDLPFVMVLVAPLSPAPLSPRFNEVAQKASHNSYDKAESIFDQLLYHRIRHLDFDLHVGRDVIGAAPAGDWWIYHVDVAGGDWSHCLTLRSCLQIVHAFHRALPNHEVVTLTLELSNDEFDVVGGRSADALDAMLREVLDPERRGDVLFTPDALLDRCPVQGPRAGTLREAVGSVSSSSVFCAWPRIDEMRGKFVILIMNKPTYYAGGDPRGRVGFLLQTKGGRPDGFLPDNQLFYGAEDRYDPWHACDPRPAYGTGFFEKKLITRVEHYNCGTLNFGADDAPTWNAFLNDRTQILSTNSINDHAGLRTRNAFGFPFQCVPGLSNCNLDQAVEDLGDPIELSVASGGVGGTSDSMIFLHDDFSSRDEAVWTAAIGTSSWGVDKGAAGCITLRQSLRDDSPHFSVCKSADDLGLFIKIRAQGCGSGPCGTAYGTSPTINGDIRYHVEDAAFVRLWIRKRPNGIWAVSAYGSFDGNENNYWAMVADGKIDWDYPQALSLQGLSASSNGVGNRNPDGSLYKFVFANVRRNDRPVGRVNLPRSAAIGNVGAKAVTVNGQRED